MPAKKSIYRKVYKNNTALEVKFFQCSVTVCLRSVYVVSMFCLCSVYVPVMFHLYSMPLETLLASKALNPYTAERRDVSENIPPERFIKGRDSRPREISRAEGGVFSNASRLGSVRTFS